jgi:hypothetical protein
LRIQKLTCLRTATADVLTVMSGSGIPVEVLRAKQFEACRFDRAKERNKKRRGEWYAHTPHTHIHTHTHTHTHTHIHTHTHTRHAQR